MVAFGGIDERRADVILPVIAADAGQAAFDSLVTSSGDTILLSDCRGVDDLQKCDIALSVAEARAGREVGAIGIVARVADSAAGLILSTTLGSKSSRLVGLGWDRAAFCADLGCGLDVDLAGHARMQVLIAARAFGLPAYDCMVREEASESDFSARARASGFAGYLRDSD